MKIDIDKIDENFFSKECGIIDTDKCYLILPKKNCNWNNTNEIFYSSIWNEDGEPVSLYFKKQITTIKKQIPLNKISIIEKTYGNSIIFSKYKGCIILRDTQNFNLKNSEIKQKIENKYKSFFKYLNSQKTLDHSFIFNNLNSDLFLTNIIEHKQYSYWEQKELDTYSLQFKFKRPIIYSIDDVNLLNDEKEVFLYYDKDQNFIKIKLKKLNNYVKK